MQTPEDVRIDKWLWAVRLYHTRALAAAACRAGQVKIAGQNAKPSRIVKIGDIISATVSQVVRTVQVIGPIEHRVGAKSVPEFLEDLTPASEYEKKHETQSQPLIVRAPGKGRPSKRERRSMEALMRALSLNTP